MEGCRPSIVSREKKKDLILQETRQNDEQDEIVRASAGMSDVGNPLSWFS